MVAHVRPLGVCLLGLFWTGQLRLAPEQEPIVFSQLWICHEDNIFLTFSVQPCVMHVDRYYSTRLIIKRHLTIIPFPNVLTRANVLCGTAQLWQFCRYCEQWQLSNNNKIVMGDSWFTQVWDWDHSPGSFYNIIKILHLVIWQTLLSKATYKKNAGM